MDQPASDNETLALACLPQTGSLAPATQAHEIASRYQSIQRLGIDNWHTTLERVLRSELAARAGGARQRIRPRAALADAARSLSDDDLAALARGYLEHRAELARSCSRQFLLLIDISHDIVKQEIRRRRGRAKPRPPLV